MKPKIKLLIVDDHKVIREATRILMDTNEDVEFLYTDAENGLEMIEWLQKEKFDLVVCDISMPNMTGEEAMIEIEKLKIAHPPIIIRSADIDKAIISRFLKLGAAAVHTKSLGTQFLFPMYKEVLEGKIFELEELNVMNKTKF
jgi:DNA-binding NarL/FixJ family response regulator